MGLFRQLLVRAGAVLALVCVAGASQGEEPAPSQPELVRPPVLINPAGPVPGRGSYDVHYRSPEPNAGWQVFRGLGNESDAAKLKEALASSGYQVYVQHSRPPVPHRPLPIPRR
jgi:hypothetical protein